MTTASGCEQRVDRLLSGSVLAQDPKPRMRRVVSNIEIEGEGRRGHRVQSNFILDLARAARQQHVWAGRTCIVLRRGADALRIRHKKVLLVNADQEMPLLQFLI